MGSVSPDVGVPLPVKRKPTVGLPFITPGWIPAPQHVLEANSFFHSFPGLEYYAHQVSPGATLDIYDWGGPLIISSVPFDRKRPRRHHNAWPAPGENMIVVVRNPWMPIPKGSKLPPTERRFGDPSNKAPTYATLVVFRATAQWLKDKGYLHPRTWKDQDRLGRYLVEAALVAGQQGLSLHEFLTQASLAKKPR